MLNPFYTLLVLIVALPCLTNGEDLPRPVQKRLYLASWAKNVMDTLVPLLPFEPNGRTACFITTASKNADWINSEIDAVEDTGLNVKRIDLAKLSKDSVASAFRGCDIIFIGGGNTFYLLQEVRRSGFDQLLKKKIEEGVPYVGISAGAVILARNIECIKYADDPSKAPDLTSFEGLNLFPLLPLVHFGRPDFKEYHMGILRCAVDAGVTFVTVTEKQFIFVEGEKWRIVDAK